MNEFEQESDRIRRKLLGKGKWRNSCVCFENELNVFAKTVIKEANASLAKGVPMKELALEKI